MTEKTIEPAIGQVWQSWDVRLRPAGGGHLKIIGVGSNGDGRTYAVCRRVRGVPGSWTPTGRADVRIKMDRLRPTSTGYRLVEDVS